MDGSAAQAEGLPQQRSAQILGSFLAVLRQLGGTLLRSRLLLSYVALGLASGFFRGQEYVAPTLFNYLVLLPFYTGIIYLWTGGYRQTGSWEGAMQGKTRASSTREVALVALLFLANAGATAWFWSGGPPRQVMATVQSVLRNAGWDRSVANGVSNGVESTLFTLVPALVIVFLLFRLRPSEVGLVPRHLLLGMVLAGIAVLLAVLLKLVYGVDVAPLVKGLELLPLAVVLFCAQAFVNGLPEEFIFRGAMFSRLLPLLRNPHHALVLASVLFVASHIPSHLAQPGGIAWWDLIPLTPSYQPTGLVWGYIFYRTRSIWPGVIWHTSWGTLGQVFMG